jgi:hypothetical protein
VSESSDKPAPYRVSYTPFVRNELEKLIDRAKERDLEAQVRAAAKEIDRRLQIYPQYGDPLIDLSLAPGQIRSFTIPPLVVRYALYDDLRLVIVATPIATLPRSGL